MILWTSDGSFDPQPEPRRDYGPEDRELQMKYGHRDPIPRVALTVLLVTGSAILLLWSLWT